MSVNKVSSSTVAAYKNKSTTSSVINTCLQYGGGGGGFFLASKDFGRMFDIHSLPALFFLLFFFGVRLVQYGLMSDASFGQVENAVCDIP